MKLSTKILLSAVAMLTASTIIAAPPGRNPPPPPSKQHHHGQPYRIINDYREAQNISARTRKPIMIIFSGSDWCGWCVKLDKEVFSRREFQNWAKDHVVVYLADFPRRKRIAPAQKRQNDELSKRYGVRGFPTVLIVDAKGKVITRTGYRPGGPVKYVQHLKRFVR